MNRPRRTTALVLALGVSPCMVSSSVQAQPNRDDRPSRPPAQRAGSGNYLERLQQIAARLADRWKAPVLVDTAIAPAAAPQVPDDSLPIAAALDAALAPLRHVTWRRIYLPPGQRETLPPAEALAAATRVLDQREPGSMIIENVVTKHLTACLKDQPLFSPSDPELRSGSFSPAPVYLMYSTAAAGGEKTPAGQFADLQRQQMELSMKPEQMALAMVQMVQLLRALAPAAFEEYAGRTLQAGQQMWDHTPPTQRQEMIQESMQLMQRFGAAPNSGAAGPGNSANSRALRPPRSSGPGQLKALAAALAARYDACFVVDPTIALAAPLELPEPDLPVEKALEAVAPPQTGIAWRRVYLTEAQLQRLPPPEKLATAVRALDQLDTGSLILEHPETQRATLFWKEQPVSATLDAVKQKGKFGAPPVYVLYSTTPSAHGGTREERFGDLQRQQIGLMLRMAPAQMAQSMDQVIQAFSSADAATRSRLMGLPIMAGMMATWFPREAKEREQAPPP